MRSPLSAGCRLDGTCSGVGGTAGRRHPAARAESYSAFQRRSSGLLRRSRSRRRRAGRRSRGSRALDLSGAAAGVGTGPAWTTLQRGATSRCDHRAATAGARLPEFPSMPTEVPQHDVPQQETERATRIQQPQPQAATVATAAAIGPVVTAATVPAGITTAARNAVASATAIPATVAATAAGRGSRPTTTQHWPGRHTTTSPTIATPATSIFFKPVRLISLLLSA